ncbi:DUF2971 domain-containing protein [uncultured Megasphaera sp.]|uniref:DUF2971 domain-containing protein n=1 Tax=uncultured Megasphaera sp. TaxID=165188 RepID=UPI002622FF5F|nr:DUF2971 domain-containing protein [uncultured Megasphaera sp.]
MDEEKLLDEVFFPYYTKKLEELKHDETKEFAYYSSLDVIHYILKDKKIWLRNASCMNDWNEIHRGQSLFFKYLRDSARSSRLFSVLSKIDDHFNWEENIRTLIENFPAEAIFSCYLASLTVHDKSDDTSGRLSMWRGYGRGIGGALILKKKEILDNDAIDGIFLSKVAYFSEEEFIDEFNKVVDLIENHIGQLKKRGLKAVWDTFRMAIISAIVSLKDPGFREEQEWRVLFFESPDSQSTDKICPETEVINGIPQRVYKLYVREILPKLLDHVIIGPTQYSGVAYMALQEDLSKLYEGTSTSIRGKLKMSTIPIRPETL